MKKNKLKKSKIYQLGFSSILAFECVAKHLNFSRASVDLNLTPTAVSNTIKNLEKQLGIRLFNRTTRSVSLTEVGRKFLREVIPYIEDLHLSIEKLVDSSTSPEGNLKLTMTNIAFTLLIEKSLGKFIEKYPDINVEIILENELIDIVSAGYDAGIRLGQTIEQDMISKVLGPTQRLVIVASPEFISQNKPLKTIMDLSKLSCIKQKNSKDGIIFPWKIFINGKTITIEDLGHGLVLSDMRHILEACKNGLGIAYVFEALAQEYISQGKLNLIFDDYCKIEDKFNIYYPSREFIPGKLRKFIDYFSDESEHNQ